MRIGTVCHSSLGGSSRVAVDLSAALARRGHTVHLFSRTIPFVARNRLQDGIRFQPLSESAQGRHPSTLDLDWSASEREMLLRRVMDVVEEDGLDLLHFHFAVPFAFLARDLKRRLGPSSPVLVGTLHGTDVSVHGRDPDLAPWLSKALMYADWLTTVSRDHARMAARLLRLPSAPQVIPNFIDPLIFHPGRNGNGGTERRKARMVHVSNFRPVKNAAGVARIFAGVRERMEAELWLVGEGEGLEPVRAFLEKEGLMENVRCWGIRSDVASILRQCDLLCVTSHEESFCLAALEAMACGAPVLAGRVGGLPELIAHGKTGFLYPPGLYEYAAELAVGLLSDPRGLQEMRKAAASGARWFSQESIATEYERLYRLLLSARSCPPAHFTQYGKRPCAACPEIMP